MSSSSSSSAQRPRELEPIVAMASPSSSPLSLQQRQPHARTAKGETSLLTGQKKKNIINIQISLDGC
jgi:hypothetical protein